MYRREFVKFAATSTALLACGSLTCTSLAACGASENKSENDFDLNDTEGACNLGIIYASRTNSAANLSSIASVEERLIKTTVAEGFLAVVLADGNPQSASTTIELESTNETRRKNEVRDDVDSVLETNFSAQAEEVDIFKALSKANNALAQASNNLENLLIVIDSGIATKGGINFLESNTRNALLDSTLLIDSLRNDGQLAKFEHIDKVVWYGLGNACGDQEEPSEGTKKAMQELYQAIFEAAGVSDISFEACDTTSPSGDNLPSVSVVDMPKIALDSEGNPVHLGDKLEFDESSSSLTFAFGTSEFSDAALAEQDLQKYIDQLKSFPDLHVTVYGYTDATGSSDANQILSEERAAAVGALLESGGVSSSQITTEGKGESSDFDTDEKNRRVEILFT